MTRERFTRQLENLREDLLRLGNRVEYALKQAVLCLETWNAKAAHQLVLEDSQIDVARYQAEDRVIKLIATQQPVASDLRLLGSVFAISSELERIGDYASSIARRLQRAMGRSTLVPPPQGLYEMADLARKMLNISLEAFLRQDSTMVQSLARYDEIVDEMEDRLQQELVALAESDPSRLEAVLDMLDIVHALERVADRATNIGERVIYWTTCVVEELNP